MRCDAAVPPPHSRLATRFAHRLSSSNIARPLLQPLQRDPLHAFPRSREFAEQMLCLGKLPFGDNLPGAIQEIRQETCSPVTRTSNNTRRALLRNVIQSLFTM